ncbi:MAG TPA: response regulator [Gemmatimonadales bacterium]|jgi:PAS domain S-box-containing protein|nr:response regulator [Gemmatimonadales bacterium]
MTLRILLAEDNPNDAALIERQLRQGEVVATLRRADSEPAFRAAIAEFEPDLILSDHSMPSFTARDTLRIVRELRSSAPVIIVTGSLDEETAVEYIKQGAADYILKTHLTRLPAAVTSALERRRAREATEAALKALRASEAQFATAFYANPSGMAITTLDGRFVDVNETFLRTLGYAREEVIGHNAVELGLWRHPEDRARMLEAVRTGGHARNLEVEFRTKAGAIRTLLYSAELVELDGTPHLLALSTDITERRQLEEQLRQSQKMEAIGQLAGGVAHDFNNILTAIHGYADLVAADLPAGDRRAEDVDEIRKAARRAAALTRQLLAFSRKQVLEPRVLDVNGLVENLDKMLQPVLGENVDLTAHLAPDLHAVRADPNQLEQVILNLAINARDAMPRGGKLTIETANVDLDEEYAARHVAVVPGRYVMLAVSDTGTGMDAQTQARIFEPFFTTKEPGKGTGLGLSTVYGIVKQSGGNIWLYSEPGRGTTFKIYLPATDASAAAAAPAASATRLDGVETVLLAEDDEPLRRLARRALASRGYTVLEADGGAAALEVGRRHAGPIHLLLTDVVIPDMDGRTLAQALRAERPELRVLYMSGYADKAIVHHGVLDPDVAYLAKPFTTEAVARKVREVLDAS